MILTDPENDPIVSVYLSTNSLTPPDNGLGLGYHNGVGLGYHTDLLPLNRDWFWFDEKMKRLHFAVDYDLENGNYPRAGLLTIEAVDDKGATGTAQIQVHIAGM